MDTVNAQTGPIFWPTGKNTALKEIVAEEKTKPALYDFVSDDGIRHRVCGSTEQTGLTPLKLHLLRFRPPTSQTGITEPPPP